MFDLSRISSFDSALGSKAVKVESVYGTAGAQGMDRKLVILDQEGSYQACLYWACSCPGNRCTCRRISGLQWFYRPVSKARKSSCIRKLHTKQQSGQVLDQLLLGKLQNWSPGQITCDFFYRKVSPKAVEGGRILRERWGTVCTVEPRRFECVTSLEMMTAPDTNPWCSIYY